MDSVLAIQSRIAAIQSRIAELDPSRATGVGTTTVGSASLGSASFGSVLAEVQSVAGAVDVAGGASLVDSDDVPIALKTYGNGKIPDAALSPIAGGDGHQLWAPAARSFEALRAAAAADGVTMGITDSYRTYESQVDLAARKGLYAQGGLAAVPGTSRHGWGMALDLQLDSAAQAWMVEHADEYGFTTIAREPWHWEYHPTH